MMRGMLKKIVVLLGCLLLTTQPLWSQEEAAFPETDLEMEPSSPSDTFPETAEFEEDEAFDAFSLDEQSGLNLEMDSSESEGASSWIDQLLAASRFTLKHEISYKTEEPEGIVNNRDSIRLEFSRFFWNTFFLQFDTKLSVYWGNDHRGEARSDDEDPLLETSSKEAFLQASIGDTSIKAGIQVMVWGESDGGAITDVISPRDYSELFFISLEESRIGQAMAVLDQFSDWGQWSLFYIPEPEFNEYPEEGSAYDIDPFEGMAEFQDSTSDKALDEYGLRWKKTVGKSDLAIMAASLIENDYAYRLDGYTSSGKLLLTKTRQRFTMVGLTFNFVSGQFLYKGELARKSPQSFNDEAYQIVKKDVTDLALGIEYASGGSYTLGLEAVNSHIHDWEETIQGVEENTTSLVISWSKSFLNEELDVNWTSSTSRPYVAYFHSLKTSYDWNDHITIELEAFYPDVPDEENSYYPYRDQKQIALKTQLQF